MVAAALLDCADDAAPSASLRGSAWSPVGPGAVPCLKLLMAFLTWFGEILKGGVWLTSSGG